VGFDFWTSQLLPPAGSPLSATSTLSDVDFYVNLTASAEYGLRATDRFYNSVPDQNWVNQMFLDVLGRTLRSDETAYFTSLIRSGVPYAVVAQNIFNSEEFFSKEIV